MPRQSREGARECCAEGCELGEMRITSCGRFALSPLTPGPSPARGEGRKACEGRCEFSRTRFSVFSCSLRAGLAAEGPGVRGDFTRAPVACQDEVVVRRICRRNSRTPSRKSRARGTLIGLLRSDV